MANSYVATGATESRRTSVTPSVSVPPERDQWKSATRLAALAATHRVRRSGKRVAARDGNREVICSSWAAVWCHG
jgi:hypothetical protein